jgi:ATP-dependent RNA helicase DeaD
MPTFADLGLSPEILQALERLEYKEPLAIQAETIPIIQQRRDLIALAQTGSGKTASCAIPICDRINVNLPQIQALIVVPTRELALQYATETQKIGKEKTVRAFALYGGEEAEMQRAKLKHGVHILVATPGRLIDFIYSRSIDLTHVETLVLDEADEMLSMGFYDDLEFIIQCLVQEHQTLLFSATMPPQIRKIAKQHMRDPAEITLITNSTGPEKLEHRFVYCKRHHRETTLIDLITQIKPKQGIVFCRSRHECEAVSRALGKYVDGVDYLHAGLTQDIRSIITNKFRAGKIRFLIATDVASRGLDFSGISHVFIYHLAEDPDLYMHRAGRTGRRDREGMVISLITDSDLSSLQDVLKRIQRPALWLGDPPPEDAGRSRPPQNRRRYPPSNRRPHKPHDQSGG